MRKQRNTSLGLLDPPWFRRLILTAFLFLIFAVLPSYPAVRSILSAPLVVHRENARGDACYVLDGGDALWERLDAAADLIQMGRVSKIYLEMDEQRSRYSFQAHRSLTGTEWRSEYLAWRGVPSDRICWVPRGRGPLGTWSEAGVIARQIPAGLKALVVVSSPPHMRRAVLALRRALPPTVQVVPYAATGMEGSYELYHPIWLEYFKLLVYFIVAH